MNQTVETKADLQPYIDELRTLFGRLEDAKAQYDEAIETTTEATGISKTTLKKAVTALEKKKVRDVYTDADELLHVLDVFMTRENIEG